MDAVEQSEQTNHMHTLTAQKSVKKQGNVEYTVVVILNDRSPGAVDDHESGFL